MAVDTTDSSFTQDVLERSDTVPVVIDLWAPWCGPCRSLGPIIEKVIDEQAGKVDLVKVNIDENPGIAQAFKVQSIPAVFAMRDRKVVDSFIGALPEQNVRQFVESLLPSQSEADQLVVKGDEASLRRAVELEPDHAPAIAALAQLLVDREENDQALELLGRIPETPQTRHLSAKARLGLRANLEGGEAGTSIEERLEALLSRVKDDNDARQEYIDLIESLSEDDPRRAQFRRALASRLF